MKFLYLITMFIFSNFALADYKITLDNNKFNIPDPGHKTGCEFSKEVKKTYWEWDRRFANCSPSNNCTGYWDYWNDLKIYVDGNVVESKTKGLNYNKYDVITSPHQETIDETTYELTKGVLIETTSTNRKWEVCFEKI